MSSLYGKLSYGADNFNNYGNNKYLEATKEFLESNSIVAKLSFLILVIFIFIILLRLGITILSYIFSFSPNPILVDGMIDGENLIIKKQNPNISNSIPILRSKNERDGLEFTWSVWLWVRNPPFNSNTMKDNQYRHIFSKGSDIMDHGIAKTNAPGLYISSDYRDLKVILDTFNEKNTTISISDLPIEKWINVMIRVNQKQLDIFINGTLTRSKTLMSLPTQNYDDVYIAMNGGFSGNLSSLRYFSYALGTNQIQNIIEAGPNLTPLGTSLTKSVPYYLSLRWFYPQQIRL